MAGITGIMAFNQVGGFYMVNLAKSIDSMVARGEQIRGSFLGKGFVALGGRDHAQFYGNLTSKQPYTEPDGRYTIVADCQLANLPEIKENLVRAGQTFETQSVSEIVLRLYLLYKEACPNMLTGAYAFAVYDEVENALFLARDPLGQKPLYFYKDEDKFIFASQLKAMLAFHVPAVPDFALVLQNLQTGYGIFQERLLKNIYSVLPGTSMVVEDKQVSAGHPNIPVASNLNANQTKLYPEQIFDHVGQEIELLAKTAASAGILLTGNLGVYMLAVQAKKVMQEVFTYAFQFPKTKSDNGVKSFVKQHATNHQFIFIEEDHLQSEARKYLAHLDEPFGDSHALLYAILFKEIKKNTSCVLSGTGAELIQGPAFWRLEKMLEKEDLLNSFIKKFGHLFGSLFKKEGYTWSNLYEELQLSSTDRFWKSITVDNDASIGLFKDPKGEGLQLELDSRMQELFAGDIKTKRNSMLRMYVSEVLEKRDLYIQEAMAATNNLNLYCPYLGPQLLPTLQQVQEMSSPQRKNMVQLWESTMRSTLPKETYKAIQNPKTQHQTILTMLKPMVLQDKLLGADFIESQGIFDFNKIKALKAESSGSQNELLWRLLVFQHWYKKYLVKTG